MLVFPLLVRDVTTGGIENPTLMGNNALSRTTRHSTRRIVYERSTTPMGTRGRCRPLGGPEDMALGGLGVVSTGAPEWMRYMVYGLGGYAMLNFAIFLFQAPKATSGANPPLIVWRGFSGHWMAFYLAALAILYPASVTTENRT